MFKPLFSLTFTNIDDEPGVRLSGTGQWFAPAPNTATAHDR